MTKRDERGKKTCMSQTRNGASATYSNGSVSTLRCSLPSGQLELATNIAPFTFAMRDASYIDTLDALARIRDVCQGELSLPQLCVVGDQSSGKSSLLQCITGVDFPVKSGLCTRVPTLVECRRTETESCELRAGGGAFTDVAVNGIAVAIAKAQQSLLGDAKIGSTEITLRLSGPMQDDLDIVDLPGIIHNGPGSEDTIQLIDRYVRSEQTLILVVSEAKQDNELTAALNLAAKHDPTAKRTLRILTKFDNFDSTDSQENAEKLVTDAGSDPLGPHAVVCRALGGQNYDSEYEDEAFFKMASSHTGIPALRARLQPLYIELIRTNLSTLEKNALTTMHEAQSSLRKLGDTPLGAVPMLREAQRSLKMPQHSFTCAITPAVDRLREAVHATGERITPPFVEGLVKRDAFMCPFFQGEIAFKAGMAQIVEWWRPLLERFVKEVTITLEASLAPIKDEAVGVSERLKTTITVSWAAASAKLVEAFRSQLLYTLEEEMDFGTINHYLQQKHVEEQLMPDSLIEMTITALSATVQGEYYCATDVRNKMIEAREAAASSEKRATVGEFVTSKLLCALKANWAVEKKTFTDQVLKKTRDSIVRKRDEFIDLMVADDTLRSEAVEDDDVGERRTKLKNTIRAMQQVISEVNGLKGSASESGPTMAPAASSASNDSSSSADIVTLP